MKFRSHTLPNGLEVIAECNPEARSTALGFFVNTGARDETAEASGVSHFLEHMVFKGTPHRSADEVNRTFDEMGAHYNAYTTKENTVYYASVLPEHQTTALELLADIMRPSIREEDFDTEKQVIIEEIRMYEDQPPFGGDDKCETDHYGSHPLAQSVLGTVESITDLSVEAMRRYLLERYSPGNIALVGAGRIDFDQFVDQANQHCGDWKPFEARRELQPSAAKSSFTCLHKEAATQEYVIQLADAPGAIHDDRYAAKILATVLGDDTGSRLYWALVDPGLAEHASIGHYDYQETGLFMTSFSCTPEQTKGNLQIVHDIFRQAEREGISPVELTQAKNKINSRVVLGSERPRVRLFNVGGNWVQRREYRSVKDDLDAVEAITVDDCVAVLAKYPLSQNTTYAIGPIKNIDPPG